MGKKNYSNRYYSDNKRNSIANSLLVEEKTSDYVTTTNASEEVQLFGPVVVEDAVAAVEEKETDLSKYEVVQVLSFTKKALCDVNVRSTPEKKNGNIVRVLKKGETIQVFQDMGIWSKVEGDNYIMSEFLG